MCLFHETVKSKFSKITRDTLNLKVIYMNFFSIAERNLNELCNKGFKDHFNENDLITLAENFYGLGIFNATELDAYMYQLGTMRDTIAHFNKFKSFKLVNNWSFLDKIKMNNKLLFNMNYYEDITFYGLTVLLSLLLCKNNIKEMVNSLLTIKEFRPYNEVNKEEFNTLIEDNLKKIALPDKGIMFVPQQEFNGKLRLQLIKILMTFEMELSYNYGEKLSAQSLDILELLKNDKILKRYIHEVDLIKFTRNSLYHGAYLGDDILFNGKLKKLSITFILKTLNSIKKIIISNDIAGSYGQLLNCMNDFAKEIITNKFLKLAELSFKIIDKDLFKSNAIKKRVEKANEISTSIIKDDCVSIKNSDIKEAIKLLNDDEEIVISINHNRFDDIKRRSYVGSTFHLLHYISNNNIHINDIDTGKNEIYLLKDEKELKHINDIFEKENLIYKNETKKLNDFLDISDIYIKEYDSKYKLVSSY